MFRFLNIFFRIKFYFFRNSLLHYTYYQDKLIKKIIKTNIELLKNKNIDNKKTFKENCIPITYNDIEKDILHFIDSNFFSLATSKIISIAKSSGTSSTSKFLPHTQSSINSNFTAGLNLIASYIYSFPDTKILNGKNFSLTGSISNKNGLLIGDISALIAYYLPSKYYYFRVPSKNIAIEEDWNLKMELLIKELSKSDITWIAGVPSWIYKVIISIEEYTNKKILEIWPNLEVFFYGGTSIEFYKSKFDTIFEKKVRYWEVYNSSEAFIGFQLYSNSKGICLLSNGYNYFEFLDTKNNIIEEKLLQIGQDYELLITNNNGLYRYRIGDIVKILNLHPLEIKIIGRTKSYINVFGEELMQYNVESAFNILKKDIDFEILEYNVAPFFDANVGFHQYLIEFSLPPNNIIFFETKLDQILQTLNSDYAAKRYNNLILKPLKVVVASKNQFQKWLENSKSNNPQSKILKLSNENKMQLEILSYI